MYFTNTFSGIDRPWLALIKPETRRQIIMRINLIAMLMTMALMQAAASSFGQYVTLHKKNADLNEVLKTIKNQTSYTFLYNSRILKDAKPVTLNLEKATLEEALKACFENQLLTFKIIEKTVLVKKKEADFFDRVTSYLTAIDLRGQVLDETGKPLVGASIRVKNTSKAVLSNDKGEFEIKGIDENAILVISFLGYKTKEVPATRSNNFTVNLEVNPAELGEVAVVSTGYQKIPKERASGSFSVVTGTALSRKLQTNVLDRLEGMAAGLTSFKNGSMSKPAIQVRGVSTLTATAASPLFVVDGAPFYGDMQSINPSEIESITVLKDASAASIYGAQSSNGVIVITTRSGVVGKLNINYDASAKFIGLPDREYANRMSSAELVDFQREMFNARSGTYAAINPRNQMVETYRLYYEARQGNISEEELQKQLNVLRNNDRYDQVVEEFLRKTAVTQQHNLSFSGGNDFYKYHLSGNYLGTAPYEREQYTSRLGFNLKNSFNFTKWMTANIGVLGSNTRDDYNNGSATSNASPGMSILYGGKASFFMLRNDDGSLANTWLVAKSPFEINRLISLGLEDENYSPVAELDRSHLTNTNKYLNLNLSTNFKILDGLNLNLLYQSERTESYSKQLYSKDSYRVKTQVNNATIVGANNVIRRLIPQGGQVSETRGDQNSYILRAQVDYNKMIIDKHRIDIIAGAERRNIKTSGTNIYKYGYDDYSLNYKPIDELALSQPTVGTQATTNQFTLAKAETGFGSTEDRFISFYSNGSYTYNNKLTVSGSIRIDQSNLFGTDPKYQYKPFWHTGLRYLVAENKLNWLDRLAVRATYGENGAVPKQGGPYMISRANGNNINTGESQDNITSPPNNGLRWERTKVTNFGLDVSVFNRRISGSVDVYNKSTSDLLGNMISDPTLGWTSLVLNYGDMRNRGIDVALTSNNLNSRDVNWTTTVNFNYNQNRLTRIDNTSNTVASYLNGPQNRKGVAMGSLYSVKYGGLDNKGDARAIKLDGTEVYATDRLAVEDLVYSGTTIPPYSASLQNTLSYKGFDLYLMFIYYGGNVMRDVTAPFLSKFAELNYATNMDRTTLNYWKKPGDELVPGMAPAFRSAVGTTITGVWESSDQNIQKADYIKLRDIILSYNFSGNWMKKSYIKNMRLSLQIQNAWRWAANKNKLDTEVWDGTVFSYSVTPTRGTLYPASYTLGLSVNF
ncbi:SusC/RagA family TonB-linked outer membrane protein [Pedobacter sp. MC2016-14]|uniref:SusC/RagA family TonB-linked outer membrane protein n=1 Tax=Pedobacter sp. MC2016-14 TaxID=2897327 RepID=UPI001E50A5B6|nr:SusC/RagA family TonB-linked outer membrane protein [Pedobacter sp. MC2016-14]MCD0488338.1 SusC/RagA family TonB-linked outer membrane protein [Pedobacter sp. MC2016-14]